MREQQSCVHCACLQAYKHAYELYSHVHRDYLRLEGRAHQMALEVKQFMPDILALQEVDRMDVFNENLAALG